MRSEVRQLQRAHSGAAAGRGSPQALQVCERRCPRARWSAPSTATSRPSTFKNQSTT